MKAVLLALDEVNGDLSNGQAALKNALSNMAFDTPTGPVSLDENRQAILSNYVSEIVRLDGGGIGPKVLLSIADVTQTLGMDRAEFMKFGPVSRENPSCP
jgi:branched-chain amino acid transport system substrate-binding protein